MKKTESDPSLLKRRKRGEEIGRKERVKGEREGVEEREREEEEE